MRSRVGCAVYEGFQRKIQKIIYSLLFSITLLKRSILKPNLWIKPGIISNLKDMSGL